MRSSNGLVSGHLLLGTLHVAGHLQDFGDEPSDLDYEQHR